MYRTIGFPPAAIGGMPSGSGGGRRTPGGTPISARVDAGTLVTLAMAAADPVRGFGVDGVLVAKTTSMTPTTATTAPTAIHGNHRIDAPCRGAAGRLLGLLDRARSGPARGRAPVRPVAGRRTLVAERLPFLVIPGNPRGQVIHHTWWARGIGSGRVEGPGAGGPSGPVRSFPDP